MTSAGEDAPASWRVRATERSEQVIRVKSRALERAEHIVSIARQLYFDTGGEPFTIQQLTERAGIALKTFYRYFETKDELLLAVLEDVLREGADSIWSECESFPEPLDRLRHLVVEAIEKAASYTEAGLIVREHRRLVVDHARRVDTARERWREHARATIHECIEAGSLPPRANVDHDVRIIANIIGSRYHELVEGSETATAEEVAEHAWAFCLAALSAPGTAAPG